MTVPADRVTDNSEGPAISILIVAYNSAAFIADCIGSVIAHTAPGSYEILLVDNGTDGTAAKVAAEFPQVRIIPGQGNIGFGRGNNLLAEHARGEFLLLLNPDTRLVDPAIDRLLAFARSQPGAAWGGVSTAPDGMVYGANFLAIPTMARAIMESVGFSPWRKNLAQMQKSRGPWQVEILSGGFMMIKRSTWDALGGFDPSFLLYSEEVDLFTRLKALGGTVWLTRESRIIHDLGGGNAYSSVRMRYFHMGQMHYIRRHWQGPTVLLFGLVYWLTAARRWLVSVLLSPVSASHRARRHAFTPIVWRPGMWWRGYAGRSALE